jgi:type III pantothenate kinase
LTEVRHGMHLPFALQYDTPHTLGNDRLAAAAAAWLRYGKDVTRSVVAVDAGTAVTFEVVDGRGVYRGGPIGAGPGLLRRALREGTAQLPAVPLELPEEIIGRSTQEAIQSGIMYGFLDGVAGILHRIEERLGTPPFIVTTGGWGAFLHEYLPSVDACDPHLVLHGIHLLMGLNPT